MRKGVMSPSKKYPEYAPPQYQRSLFSISEIYHEHTKYRRCKTSVMPYDAVDRETLMRRTRAFKSYPGLSSIKLLRTFDVASCPVEEAIQRRRSRRQFSTHPVSFEELSRLLYFANGVTVAVQSEGLLQPFRAAPSAGGLYPIEIYTAVFNVTDIGKGIYYYNARRHSLDLLMPGTYNYAFGEALLGQEWVRASAVLLVLSAVFPRTTSKYGERGYRFALLDAGHIGENIYLMATAMELAVVGIGGFYDDDVNALLGIDGVNEAAVYAVAVGKPASGS